MHIPYCRKKYPEGFKLIHDTTLYICDDFKDSIRTRKQKETTGSYDLLLIALKKRLRFYYLIMTLTELLDDKYEIARHA